MLAMAGVDRQPPRLLGAFDVVVLEKQQTQAVPGRRSVLRVRGIDRLLKRRPRSFDVALLGQPGAEAEGSRRVIQARPGRGAPRPPERLHLRFPVTLPVYHRRSARVTSEQPGPGPGRLRG